MTIAFEMTRKLFKIKKNYSCMEEYITDVMVRVQRLAGLGGTIGDKCIAVAIRKGISEKCETLVFSINQQVKGQLIHKIVAIPGYRQLSGDGVRLSIRYTW